MIAAVRRWYAALAAILFLVPSVTTAADDLTGAVRELAHDTEVFAGKGASVSLIWRNFSQQDSLAAQARIAFEAALNDAGMEVGAVSGLLELRVTFSENDSQFLLVEEAAKGEDHQTWIAAWKRGEPGGAMPTGINLEKKLLWQQPGPILDIALVPSGMLILSPANITFYGRTGNQWQAQGTVPLFPAKPWPADPRGRLRLKGANFQALIPGMECDGATDPFTAECHASEEPWVLESGSRALMLAEFASARNYFTGRITTQTGQPKTVAPFFSAASVESQGRTWWLLAGLDGKTQVFDSDLDPTGGPAFPWGSDIAGTGARCGGGSQVLVTRPGDQSQPDAVQALTMAGGAVTPLTEAVNFQGPVTALWPAGTNAITAVVRDLQTGSYSAYLVTVVCGE